jgi:RNA polymerase sigma-70 factor (ECF subfamily)
VAEAAIHHRVVSGGTRRQRQVSTGSPDPVDLRGAADPSAAAADETSTGEARMTAAKQTDARLVERAQRGDKRAFDLLVLRYQHRIQGLVSRYVRDQDEIQDVVQDAFLKAYRALPRFRGDSQFYTWIYRIAINTAKNHLVSRSRRPPSDDVDAQDAEYHGGGEALTDVASPERELAGEQLKQAVFGALEALPDELRTAVTLREFDGLSYEEIAEIMECPVGTVRSRIFRAREAIDAVVRPLMTR